VARHHDRRRPGAEVSRGLGRYLIAAGLAGAVALLAAVPAAAAQGRIAVGLFEGTPVDVVSAEAERLTGSIADRALEPLGASFCRSTSSGVPVLRRSPGGYAEPVEGVPAAFVPTDPLATFSGTSRPSAHSTSGRPPRQSAGGAGAVVDSGIQGDHPEFAGRIVAARSFVAAKATEDTIGHGTLIAGEIAAAMENALGVAGVGFPARLLIAKVVGANGGITTEAEAKAIRWAVDSGRGGQPEPGAARPRDCADQYSALERDAVVRVRTRAVVVDGRNCQGCPARTFASYRRRSPTSSESAR
jgi:hypothetical protein